MISYLKVRNRKVQKILFRIIDSGLLLQVIPDRLLKICWGFVYGIVFGKTLIVVRKKVA